MISTDSESDPDPELDADTSQLDEQAKLDAYKVEKATVLKQWRKIKIDWREEFSEHKSSFRRTRST